LHPLRNLFALGIWRSRIHIEHGHVQRGLDECLAVISAGSHLSESKFVLELVHGRLAHSIGHEGVLDILSTQMLLPAELEDVQQRLSDVFPHDYPTIDMEGESIIFRDVVQHTFTHGGIGGGHLMPQLLPPLVRLHSVIITMTELDTEPSLEQKASCTAISLLHARRKRTVARYLHVCDQAEDIARMTPYDRRFDGIVLDITRPHILNYRIELDSFITGSRYFLVGMLMPAVERISDLMHEATRTVLALHRYQLERGEYPKGLKQLMEMGYVDGIPTDPYSSKPFVYEKVNGDFRLYSVGRNFVDDDGEIAYRAKRPATWGTEEKGDAVFWPYRTGAGHERTGRQD